MSKSDIRPLAPVSEQLSILRGAQMPWTLLIAIFSAHPGVPGIPAVPSSASFGGVPGAAPSQPLPPTYTTTLTYQFASKALADAAASSITAALKGSPTVGVFACVFQTQ